MLATNQSFQWGIEDRVFGKAFGCFKKFQTVNVSSARYCHSAAFDRVHTG